MTCKYTIIKLFCYCYFQSTLERFGKYTYIFDFWITFRSQQSFRNVSKQSVQNIYSCQNNAHNILCCTCTTTTYKGSMLYIRSNHKYNYDSICYIEYASFLNFNYRIFL